MPTVIWWIRRDLRLHDNPVLTAALEAGERVEPVFVLDPVFARSRYTGAGRRAFLFGGLRVLDGDLRRRGSRLVVRRGRPAEALARLVAETGARAVFAQEEYSPYARRRDAAVAAVVPLRRVHGLTVHPPEAVVKADGTPYTVFGPFSRAWKTLAPPRRRGLIPAPSRLVSLPDLTSAAIPVESGRMEMFPPGEAEARRRLRAFAREALPRYAEDRNRMDLDGTSCLSPYLRFGMLSAREAVVSAVEGAGGASAPGRRGAQVWLTELIWREFYQAILRHFPLVSRTAFRAELRDIRWDNETSAFAAWCEGRTGYPIVDAGMRQLVRSGWMHNRARMIAGSFLVKDLLIDWRWGERFFMQHLLDGDPAANNGGWQWVAGVGTDAAPYFRIFNPVLQGRRFDPDGAYIRRWVPELARVPAGVVHEPWRMNAAAQQAAGCVIGRDYPPPIVDHRAARERTLGRYAQARTSRARSGD
jgi:deoxyribodipyrimidine photo-lyase